MSNSLRLLRGNEGMRASLKKFWLNKSKILFYYVLFTVKKKNFKQVSESLISSFLVKNVSESLILLKSNERYE